MINTPINNTTQNKEELSEEVKDRIADSLLNYGNMCVEASQGTRDRKEVYREVEKLIVSIEHLRNQGYQSGIEEGINKTLEHLSDGQFLRNGLNWNEMSKEKLKDIFLEELIKSLKENKQ